MQELYVWTHAMTFLLAAGFAYLLNAHVRVDIFYAKLGRRGKAWIDLFGVIFLLMPWLVLLAWTAWTYVSYSWQTSEISVQSNGMPGHVRAEIDAAGLRRPGGTAGAGLDRPLRSWCWPAANRRRPRR